MAPEEASDAEGLGWAILAAALAVPGFLFYNWWSHLKTDRDHAILRQGDQARRRRVFQTPSAHVRTPGQPHGFLDEHSGRSCARSRRARARRSDPPRRADRPGDACRNGVRRSAAVGSMPPGRTLGGLPADPRGRGKRFPAEASPSSTAVSTTTTVVLSRDR